jgi:hypothetical protein
MAASRVTRLLAVREATLGAPRTSLVAYPSGAGSTHAVYTTTNASLPASRGAIRFAIRSSVFHCFSCTLVPSVALHVVEFRFLGGFEFLPLRHSF